MKNAAEDILPGSIWSGPYAPKVRVMTTCEGWVMHRIPGCMVCVTHHKDFRREYKPVATA